MTEATTTTETETKRDRVRRLLLAPLADAGFRHPKGTEDGGALLDRIADDLAYMTDEGLDVLRACMATKGDGASRCFWPPLASFRAFAEAYQPRPIEEVPAVARWFASAAGREALAEGRLVAEFLFWQRHKHPPVSQQHRRLVAEDAVEQTRRAELIGERKRLGLPLAPGDDDWLAGYSRILARATALVGEAAA